MMKIDGLDDGQVHDATNILVIKHDLLRVFYNVPNQLKKGYILKIQILSRGFKCSYFISLLYFFL